MFWVWLIGYLWFWRYTVGYVLASVVGYDPDGVDYIFAMLFATIANIVWPIGVAGRIIYVIAKKNNHHNIDLGAKFFPKPKEIETGEQKHRRIEREKRDLILAHQKHVNDRERELGMELTRW